MGENPKSLEPAPPSRPSSPAPLIGSTVAHYRILERLGGGGMGVVYKGWDLRLERYAAVKFLSPQRSGSDDFKRRFAREARTASRLEHPNICTVFETDETEDGRLFIAMAFCEGESLKRKIERGPLPLPQALAVGAQVAAGLAAAHEKGVVHRDVKPGNIMVAEDGRVKIVDFGIARYADETRLTRTGDVMGTTAYLAPEQFLSADTDQRVDLWSLGVVLYEMVAGRLPWSGGDERELVNAIVKRAARPLSAQRPGIPQALERLVARALAKRPAERYQRAEELRADLLAVAELVAEPGSDGPYEQTVVEAPLPPSRERPPQPPAPAPARGPVEARGDAETRGEAGSAERAVAGSVAGADAAREADETRAPGSVARAPGTGEAAAGLGSAAAPERRPGGGMLGKVIAHYRIVGPLGGGGMGVVYKAQDLSLERIVALKFLPPELTRDPDAKTRFLQEARAASALDHPNICTIHEVGETDEGQLYLAMACYDGETLKQRLQRGRLPIDEALETAQQVARGLVKAHRHGIVHRDIKPANLMITTDEIVKILDFGIAKLVGAAGLTRAGSSLGTPGYMSPEQARGEEVDPRTDVWSLGAVLYEMVTGRRPFRGEHEQTVLYSLFNDEPEPVQQLRPDAPPELARIIGRMLAKDPEQRYPTAAAAFADLRALYGPVTGTGSLTATSALIGTTSVPALALPAAPRRRRLVAAALAAVLVAGSLIGWLLLRRQGAAATAHQTHDVRLTDLEGKETFPALSPDGNQFVYVKSVGGRLHIFWQRVGGGNALDLSKDSTSDDTQPAYSPDGAQIAFRSERDGGGIFLMGSTGESARRLTNAGYNPAWSPDGREIVFATEGIENPVKRSGLVSQLWRVKVSGGEPHLIHKGDAVQPSWSPHGSRIAYWSVAPGGGQRVLWTIPAGGGVPVQVTNDAQLNWSPAWFPDGRYLYFSSDRGGPLNIWRVPIDEASGKVLGAPESLTTPSPSSGFVSFSSNGRHMAYASDESRSNIESQGFDPDAGRVTAEARRQVTHGARHVRSSSMSPDGGWIAYDTSAPQEDVFIIRPDGSGWRQLTDDPWKDRIPTWSGDGSRIIFYSNRSGKYEAWAIHPDGSGLEQLTSISGAPVFDSISSPDGKRLACNMGGTNAAFIDLTAPLAKRLPQPLPLLPGGGRFNVFSWSRDAARLAGTDENQKLVVYAVATGTYQRLEKTGASPIWMKDSRRLLYLVNGGVYLLDLSTGAGHEVLKTPAGWTFRSVTVSPDDGTLYVVSASQEGDIWLRTSDQMAR